MGTSVLLSTLPGHQSMSILPGPLSPSLLPLRVLITSPQLGSLPRSWYVSSLAFFHSKEKKMILVDLCFLLVESLCLLPAAYRIKPTLSSMMHKIFQTLVPPYTVSCHFPQCCCHWASKSSTNTPSFCNIQSFLSLKAFPTSAPRVCYPFSYPQPTWVLTPLQALPASPRETLRSL